MAEDHRSGTDQIVDNSLPSSSMTREPRPSRMKKSGSCRAPRRGPHGAARFAGPSLTCSGLMVPFIPDRSFISGDCAPIAVSSGATPTPGADGGTAKPPLVPLPVPAPDPAPGRGGEQLAACWRPGRRRQMDCGGICVRPTDLLDMHLPTDGDAEVANLTGPCKAAGRFGLPCTFAGRDATPQDDPETRASIIKHDRLRDAFGDMRTGRASAAVRSIARRTLFRTCMAVAGCQARLMSRSRSRRPPPPRWRRSGDVGGDVGAAVAEWVR